MFCILLFICTGIALNALGQGFKAAVVKIDITKIKAHYPTPFFKSIKYLRIVVDS